VKLTSPFEVREDWVKPLKKHSDTCILRGGYRVEMRALWSPMIQFHYEHTNVYIIYLLVGGMTKKVQGKLTQKQSVFAVIVSLATVIGIIEFGVL